MSLSDAFGPAPHQSKDAAAILRVRTSIYARLGPSNAYRSPLAIAVMYAAELDAGGVIKASRRKKMVAEAAKLTTLKPSELEPVLKVARELLGDTEDELVKTWARRAIAVLKSLLPSSAPLALAGSAAPRAARAAVPSDVLARDKARLDRVTSRMRELQAEGLSRAAAEAAACAELEADDESAANS